MDTDPRVIENAQEHEGLVCASQIIIKQGNFPARIVLRRLSGQFVTHMEILEGTSERVDPTGTGCMFKHRGYHQGNYFGFKHGKVDWLPTEEEALKKAVADFKERAAKL